MSCSRPSASQVSIITHSAVFATRRLRYSAHRRRCAPWHQDRRSDAVERGESSAPQSVSIALTRITSSRAPNLRAQPLSLLARFDLASGATASSGRGSPRPPRARALFDRARIARGEEQCASAGTKAHRIPLPHGAPATMQRRRRRRSWPAWAFRLGSPVPARGTVNRGRAHGARHARAYAQEKLARGSSTRPA